MKINFILQKHIKSGIQQSASILKRLLNRIHLRRLPSSLKLI